MNYLNHIKTPNSLIITLKDDNPIVLSSRDARFQDVIDLLDNGMYEEALIRASIGLSVNSKNTKFKIKDGVAFVDGEALPMTLSKRLVQFSDQNIDTYPLEAFWDNLRQNPSESSKESLYDFIEANHFPITKNGTFIAYKKVRNDFLDSHSGKFDNTPGNIVKMERDKVEADRNQTCSAGLHVGAYQYVLNFSGTVLLEVEVNPKDVVAVPYDYDAQKMRVCEYKVLKVCKSVREEVVYEDDTYDDEDFELPPLVEVEEVSNGQQTAKIVRVPSELKTVVINGRNQVVVPLKLLLKFGIDVGDIAYISANSGTISVGPDKTAGCKSLSVGSTGLLVTTDILKEADLYQEYDLELMATKGVLQIRVAK